MNRPQPAQVFIVGMNGSGTTMLLDCLANHSMVFGYPGETKVLPFLLQREPRYGDLRDRRNLRRLCDDIAQSVGVPFRAPVDAILSDWNCAVELTSVAAVFDQAMKRLASAEGKQIWCEKTPTYVHHLPKLAAAFPRAKFIHIVRDGRQCAASFHRRWRFNPLRTAFRWKLAVRTGQAHGKLLGHRYYEVRYEDVTSAPASHLQEICEFLSIPFEPDVLRLARSRPHMTGSDALSIVRNERRADDYFDTETLEGIESIAGECLMECGYATFHAAGDRNPPVWQLRWWEFGDDVRRLLGVLMAVSAMKEPGRWSYAVRRLAGAIKQKRSLRG